MELVRPQHHRSGLELYAERTNKMRVRFGKSGAASYSGMNVLYFAQSCYCKLHKEEGHAGPTARAGQAQERAAASQD